MELVLSLMESWTTQAASGYAVRELWVGDFIRVHGPGNLERPIVSWSGGLDSVVAEMSADDATGGAPLLVCASSGAADDGGGGGGSAASLR